MSPPRSHAALPRSQDLSALSAAGKKNRADPTRRQRAQACTKNCVQVCAKCDPHVAPQGAGTPSWDTTQSDWRLPEAIVWGKSHVLCAAGHKNAAPLPSTSSSRHYTPAQTWASLARATPAQPRRGGCRRHPAWMQMHCLETPVQTPVAWLLLLHRPGESQCKY